MAAIYALVSGELVWYVGSTTNLAKRKHNHKKKYARGIGSDLIPSEFEWELKVLEKCSMEDRYMREQYHYDTLMPLLNQQRPGQTANERARALYHSDPDKSRANNKRKYYANLERNREKARLYQKKKRDAS